MNVTTRRQGVADVDADVLVIGVFEGDEGAPAAIAGTPLADLVAGLLASKDLSGSVGEYVPLLGLAAGSGLKAKAVATLGLGKRAKFEPGTAYLAGVAAGKKLAARARGEVACVLPPTDQPAAAASALVEGLIVGTRGADLRKAEPVRHPVAGLTLITAEGDDLDAAVASGAIVGAAVNLARDLANTPPAEKTPTVLANRARAEAEAAGLAVTVWDEAKIRAERFGGLLGVAAGSSEPPAFVILEHHGATAKDAPTLALVGKGVTFDSGGLSLKPSASMEDMKADMTGSAVVLATLIAAAQLRLPVNLVGYLALTENMVNGHAMRLGDVLTMRNGKTVEVMNTDAEGRLILADALSYAAERKPAHMIDLATLTGACMVALGTKVAGLFSNDPATADSVLAASKRTGERAWQLPLDDDYFEQLKSPVADFKNVGGKWGGSITAAKFLQQFVADVPWVHLDIAGPSWADSDSSTRDAGGTGCFVRTLVDWIEHQATAR